MPGRSTRLPWRKSSWGRGGVESGPGATIVDWVPVAAPSPPPRLLLALAAEALFFQRLWARRRPVLLRHSRVGPPFARGHARHLVPGGQSMGPGVRQSHGSVGYGACPRGGGQGPGKGRSGVGPPAPPPPGAPRGPRGCRRGMSRHPLRTSLGRSGGCAGAGGRAPPPASRAATSALRSPPWPPPLAPRPRPCPLVPARPRRPTRTAACARSTGGRGAYTATATHGGCGGCCKARSLSPGAPADRVTARGRARSRAPRAARPPPRRAPR